MALKAFKEGDESPRQTSTRLQALRETRVLPRENYPRLVTFGHIGSPQTVRRVDPDNLAATFGPGYRLKSITLEITDAPVTRGEVETVLGWLGEHPETPLFPIVDPKDFSFAAKLRQGEFIRR
ncbi:hypothetical protein [Oricola sp.]|uniref:hypothetical protein n=1 Tax=Oricola sp. TaxID=1979950 RepID=UPI003BACCA87